MPTFSMQFCRSWPAKRKAWGLISVAVTLILAGGLLSCSRTAGHDTAHNNASYPPVSYPHVSPVSYTLSMRSAHP